MDKAVYGTKTAALWFHKALSIHLWRIEFQLSQAEPDFWWRKTKANGFEYVACYVDDVICYSKKPEKILENLSRFYTLKRVGKVEFFLGADLMELQNTWNCQYQSQLACTSKEFSVITKGWLKQSSRNTILLWAKTIMRKKIQYCYTMSKNTQYFAHS